MSAGADEAILALRRTEQSLRRKEWAWRAAIVALLAWAAWHVRDLRWSVVIDSAPILLKGFGRSWILALAAVVIGALLAVPLGAGRVYGPRGVSHLCVAVIEIVRSTPELMVVFWIYYALPELTGQVVSSWWAAIAALSLLAAVYLAEVIRSGLYTVPAGQWEAGVSTGLTRFQAFRYVVLPQALRNMVPAFLAIVVALFKTTALVSTIGVIEFFRAGILINNARFAPYEIYTTLAVGYLVCCSLLSWIVRRLRPKYLVVE